MIMCFYVYIIYNRFILELRWNFSLVLNRKENKVILVISVVLCLGIYYYFNVK